LQRENQNTENIKKEFRPETTDLSRYLASDDIIDYNDKQVRELADRFLKEPKSDAELAKEIYEYVRDNFGHSFDIKGQNVTCTASEVLQEGHGICYAKSHLLAALLRYVKIPTGFCYQKLILDDETAPVLILHGLNAVYLESIKRWVRIDARGNKPGVDAQFCLAFEQLAFPVRRELGEVDEPVIYASPNKNVIKALRSNKTVEELKNNLPTEL
jgi:transglutaminase-like putative cysteine protease